MRIVPTVGRIVLFWPNVFDLENRPDGEQPQAAIVTYVHSSECVNVTVFPSGEPPRPLTSVRLQQTDSPPLGDSREAHATWMTYQLGQAAKTEQAEADAKAKFDRDHPAA